MENETIACRVVEPIFCKNMNLFALAYDFSQFHLILGDSILLFLYNTTL